MRYFGARKITEPELEVLMVKLRGRESSHLINPIGSCLGMTFHPFKFFARLQYSHLTHSLP